MVEGVETKLLPTVASAPLPPHKSKLDVFLISKRTRDGSIDDCVILSRDPADERWITMKYERWTSKKERARGIDPVKHEYQISPFGRIHLVKDRDTLQRITREDPEHSAHIAVIEELVGFRHTYTTVSKQTHERLGFFNSSRIAYARKVTASSVSGVGRFLGAAFRFSWARTYGRNRENGTHP